MANTFYITNNSTAAPLVLSGTPIVNFIGATSTNTATRLDATGFRIGTLADAHTANTHKFAVTGSAANNSFVYTTGNKLTLTGAGGSGVFTIDNVASNGGGANFVITQAYNAAASTMHRLMTIGRGEGGGSVLAGCGVGIGFDLPSGGGSGSTASVADAVQIGGIWSRDTVIGTASSRYGAFVVRTMVAGAAHAEAWRISAAGITNTLAEAAAYIHLKAGVAGSPQMMWVAGVAPTGGALVDGAMWFDGTDFKARIGGVTKTFTLT